MIASEGIVFSATPELNIVKAAAAGSTGLIFDSLINEVDSQFEHPITIGFTAVCGADECPPIPIIFNLKVINCRGCIPFWNCEIP